MITCVHVPIYSPAISRLLVTNLEITISANFKNPFYKNTSLLDKSRALVYMYKSLTTFLYWGLVSRVVSAPRISKRVRKNYGKKMSENVLISLEKVVWMGKTLSRFKSVEMNNFHITITIRYQGDSFMVNIQ